MIHHFLNQRIVTPIPDLWLMVIAALLGKGIVLALEKAKQEKQIRKEKLFFLVLRDKRGKWVLQLASATAVYGVASLQLYITTAVVLPFVLPAATLWSFVLLGLLENKYSQR
jgi:cobalamin synthase